MYYKDLSINMQQREIKTSVKKYKCHKEWKEWWGPSAHVDIGCTIFYTKKKKKKKKKPPLLIRRKKKILEDEKLAVEKTKKQKEQPW